MTSDNKGAKSFVAKILKVLTKVVSLDDIKIETA